MIDGVTDVLSVVRRADRGAAAADRRLRSNDCRGVGGRARGWRRRNRQVAPRRRAEQAGDRGRWAVVVTGQCLDVAEGGAPYAPVHEVLAQLGDDAGSGARPAEALPAALRRAAGEQPGRARRRGRPLGRPIDPRSAHRARRRARAAPHVAGGDVSHRQPGAWQPDSRAARRARSRRARGAPPPGAVRPGDVAEQLRGHPRNAAARLARQRRAGTLRRQPVLRRGARRRLR